MAAHLCLTHSPPVPAIALRRRAALALALMVASGFAGLGMQIVWTQQCALWLGHESAAVLAVLAAFFGGLAAGALALGGRVERSARPLRWYAACEAVIGAWSLVLALSMAPLSAALLDLGGALPAPAWHWAIAFGGTFLMLLPATAAMGATLPAMERVTAQWRGGDRRSIAALYAGNTFGAVAGVLAAAFWLVPGFGLSRTALACATLQLLCAAGALTAFAGSAPAATAPAPAAAAPARGIGALLALTGLLGIGYEVVVVRVLSQVAEDTVYTYALLLAVYLVGSACGAAAYQRRVGAGAAAGQDAETLRDRLLGWLAAACLIGTGTLWAAEQVRSGLLQMLGAGMPAALAAEATLALLAFALPTAAMGALFAHLCNQAAAAGLPYGRSLGINTLGAAAAPLLFGVLMVPALGPKGALLAVSAGYLALTARRCWRRPASGITAGAALAVLLAVALWAPPLAFIAVPAGGHVVSYIEGPTAAVSVVEDQDGVSRLRIDNRQQEGSSATLHVDARQAWLPLLLHPAPRRALFLGLGTGMTARSAAEDPTLQVDAVELLPEVVASSAHFAAAFDGGATHPRLHLMVSDARRYVRAGGRRYDVVVADNFHPARSGSGSLYTVEHFRAVRGRLAAGGLFCQWLPLHQLDLGTLRSIVRSFVAAYPGGWAVLASHSLDTPVLGLLGRADDGARFDRRRLRDRLAGAALPRRLAELGLTDDFAVLGSFVAGPQALARFAGDAALNTDDHPVVAYRAPRITYAPDSLPRDRLLALLHELRLAPDELLAADADDTQWPPRLAAYWAARDLYLDAGRAVTPVADVRRMLAQVRRPLLTVLRTSADFRPAFEPLLRMAGALDSVDAAAALALRAELAQLQPAPPQAVPPQRRMEAGTRP